MKGKVALITGSATGIGRAIALRLAKEGVHIVLNYSRSEKRRVRHSSKNRSPGRTMPAV